MKARRTVISAWAAALALLLLLFLLNRAAYLYVQNSPGGASFAAYWSSTRLFLQEGRSPYLYTPERLAREAGLESGDLPDGPRPASFPLYTSIFFIPFASVSDYNAARAAWMVFLVITAAAAALLHTRIVQRGYKNTLVVAFMLFTLGSFYHLVPLLNGNAAPLAGLLVVLGLAALLRDRQEAAGFCFALALVDLFMVALLLLFVLLWAFAHGRRRFLVWFLGWLVLLTTAGLFFIPEWPLQYIGALQGALEGDFLWTPARAFASWWPGVGVRLGWAFSAFFALVLAFEWWLAFRRPELRRFLWAANLTLVLGLWTGLPVDPSGLFLPVLPAALVVAYLDERWGRSGLAAALVAMILGLALPWVVFLRASQDLQAVQHLVLPALLLFGLYWVRWLAVRPGRPTFDELVDLEGS